MLFFAAKSLYFNFSLRQKQMKESVSMSQLQSGAGGHKTGAPVIGNGGGEAQGKGAIVKAKLNYFHCRFVRTH